MLGSTGGLWRGAQAVLFIGAIRTVALAIAGEGGGDARSVATGELIGIACFVSTAQLIATVPAVVHTVTAGEEENIHSVTRERNLLSTSHQFTHNSYLLEGKKDAKSIGAGKLVQVAGPIGAVLELIRRIGTIFLPIT